MKRLLPALGALLLLCACAPKQEQAQFFAMDTVMTVTFYGKGAEGAVAAVRSEVNRLDKLWSRTDEGSEVSALNACAGGGTWVPLSEETVELLGVAQKVAVRSGMAFNPLMAPVSDAWGFTGEEQRVPGQSELEELLPLTEQSFTLGPRSGRLAQAGQALDAGGIAKGMAGDRCAQLAREFDVTGGILDLGGNITTVGGKADGTPWVIGVKDPTDPEKQLCAISVGEVTCATSGAYERYFEADGERYHHILDPATGYPARSGLLSVTAVSPQGAAADAWSTACFVLGAEKALELWREDRADCGLELILTCEDGTVYVTGGLEEGFQALGEEAGWRYEFVRS